LSNISDVSKWWTLFKPFLGSFQHFSPWKSLPCFQCYVLSTVIQSSHITCFMMFCASVRPFLADNFQFEVWPGHNSQSSQIHSYQQQIFGCNWSQPHDWDTPQLVGLCEWLGSDLDHFVPGLSDVTFWLTTSDPHVKFKLDRILKGISKKL
jgi:hypothetical protein